MFYYSNNPDLILWKHIVAHLLGVSLLAETLLNLPLSHPEVAVFYHLANMIGYLHIVVASLWELGDILPDQDMFFTVLLLSPLMAKLAYLLY